MDWDCEVFRNYSEINLGCRKRVSSGIDWLFENVKEAINLVFGFEAPNTTGSGCLYENMKFESINFPLIHPKIIEPNTYADNLENKLFYKFGFKEKIRRVFLQLGIKIK